MRHRPPPPAGRASPSRLPPPRLTVALLACATLAACATERPTAPRRPSPARAPVRARPAAPVYSTPRVYAPPHGLPAGPSVRSQPLPPVEGRPTPAPVPTPEPSASLRDLPGWAEDDHAAAFAALVAGCGVARDPIMQSVCGEARALASARGPLGDAAARSFLETRFRPAPTRGEGVLTAYFAPEYEARATPDGAFTAPVRPRPAGAAAVYAPVDDPLALLDAAPPAPVYTSLANADRLTITASPAPDALAWMRPEDLFFMQVQGSGELVFPDGRRTKALYAADNGRPFTAIARPMAELGLLPRNRVGGEDIRRWLREHAGQEADAVMNRNARYIFFRLAPVDGHDPLGASGVSLPAGRSLAVDPSFHGYGELFWIDAEAPVLTGAVARYRRAAMALDTGSAIRGDVRADLYIGRGTEAGREAGRVRHTLRMTRLVPLPPSAR